MSGIVDCQKSKARKKGKGSVEDGIQFIRSFRKIYVHPRCRNVINELGTYSWKVDRLSGDILTEPVDAFNHWIDALRYALEPVMLKQRFSFPVTIHLYLWYMC